MSEEKDTARHALMEKLAALAHGRWSHWMNYLFTKMQPHPEGKGELLMPGDCAERWIRQKETGFYDLPVKERASDFNEAAHWLTLLQDNADLVRLVIGAAGGRVSASGLATLLGELRDSLPGGENAARTHEVSFQLDTRYDEVTRESIPETTVYVATVTNRWNARSGTGRSADGFEAALDAALEDLKTKPAQIPAV